MGSFNLLVDEPDLEWEFIDGSIMKAHQHSSSGGAACGQKSAIGNPVAGLFYGLVSAFMLQYRTYSDHQEPKFALFLV